MTARAPVLRFQTGFPQMITPITSTYICFRVCVHAAAATTVAGLGGFASTYR